MPLPSDHHELDQTLLCEITQPQLWRMLWDLKDWFIQSLTCIMSTYIYKLIVWNLLHDVGPTHLVKSSVFTCVCFVWCMSPTFTFCLLSLLTHQASLSMDEAARQTSSHSLSSASSYTSATMRRPGSSQRQHRRTGSVGTVSEHEVNLASKWPQTFYFVLIHF